MGRSQATRGYGKSWTIQFFVCNPREVVMSANLPELYTEQFSANLERRLQQQGSLLRGRVRSGMHVGKAASPIQYMAAITSRAPAGVFAPMGRVDADFTRRWVSPITREIPQMIDQFELAETIVDPKAQYVTNAADAAGRDWDDNLIQAAFGSPYVGTDPSSWTTESWASVITAYATQIVSTFDDGSTSMGLTVKKLIELRRKLRHTHVFSMLAEQPTMVIGSQQEANMLSQVQFVSADYGGKGMQDGEIERFLGIGFVVSERLTTMADTNAHTCRQCIAFVPSGLYLGIWRDLTNDVSIRHDLSGLPFQLYTQYMFGGTRLEPGRLYEIDCYDTSGSDPMVT